MHQSDRILLHVLDVNCPLYEFDTDGRLHPQRFKEALTLQAISESIILGQTRLTKGTIGEIMNNEDGRIFDSSAALNYGLTHKIID